MPSQWLILQFLLLSTLRKLGFFNAKTTNEIQQDLGADKTIEGGDVEGERKVDKGIQKIHKWGQEQRSMKLTEVAALRCKVRRFFYFHNYVDYIFLKATDLYRCLKRACG